MIRRIRRYIWKLKDKGVSVRTIFLTAALIILIIVSAIAALIHGIVKNSPEKETQESSIIVTQTETDPDNESPEDSETMPEMTGIVSESVTEETVGTEVVYENFENLKSFLPDDKYTELTKKLTAACEENNVFKVALMSYQISDEKNMSIKFFAKLDNGIIYQCTYSFSKSTLTVTKSTLTEDSIVKMQKAEEEAESRALAESQKKAEKKLQKQRKKAAKKKKKVTDGG